VLPDSTAKAPSRVGIESAVTSLPVEGHLNFPNDARGGCVAYPWRSLWRVGRSRAQTMPLHPALLAIRADAIVSVQTPELGMLRLEDWL
jgi:hypothetical protein